MKPLVQKSFGMWWVCWQRWAPGHRDAARTFDRWEDALAFANWRAKLQNSPKT